MVAVGNGYSSAQILSMQKDAMRRVNEMQRTAREKLRQTQGMPDPPPPTAQGHTIPQPVEVCHVEEGPQSHAGHAAPQPSAEPVRPPVPHEPDAPAPSPENPLQGILSRLNLDGETVLLLLMLLLLVNEGADSKLIMALVYILL